MKLVLGHGQEAVHWEFSNIPITQALRITVLAAPNWQPPAPPVLGSLTLIILCCKKRKTERNPGGIPTPRDKKDSIYGGGKEARDDYGLPSWHKA